MGPGPPISHSHCPLLCSWANYWGAEDPLGFQPSSERDWLQVSQVRTSLVAQMVKNLPGMQETWVQSLDREEPLEKGMATYSSILVWSIPWTEESGRIQSMGWQRVGHDKWLTHTQKRLVQGLPGKEGPDEVEDSWRNCALEPRYTVQKQMRAISSVYVVTASITWSMVRSQGWGARQDSVWGSDRLDHASLLTQCLLILIVRTRNDLDFGSTGFQYELCIRYNCGTLGQGNLPQSTSFLICIIRLMAPPDGRKVKIKRSNAQETPMLIPGIR